MLGRNRGPSVPRASGCEDGEGAGVGKRHVDLGNEVFSFPLTSASTSLRHPKGHRVPQMGSITAAGALTPWKPEVNGFKKQIWRKTG